MIIPMYMHYELLVHSNHVLWMVTRNRIHSGCKLYLCTHWWSKCKNLSHSNHALWTVTRIFSASKLCSYVHTDDHNLKNLAHSNHALWTVTQIHLVCKLCSYVHTDDHDVKILLIPTMPCGWWLGFTQAVSCTHMNTLMIIMWESCSFQPCPVDGDSDSLSV